jgi:hypothetical protein
MKIQKYIILALLSIFFSCKSTKNVPKVDLQQAFVQKINKVVVLKETKNIFSGLSEPSICINKANTNNIIGGSIYDNVHVSDNQGLTWKNMHLKSKHGVFGDPCLASDDKGNIYYLHLANPGGSRSSKEFLSSIVIQKSTDEGKTWTDGVAIGYNNNTVQDKHWIAIDPKTGALAVTWTEFDAYDSKKPEDHSRILFSRSDDFGSTWTKPISISQFEGDCQDDDYTTEGAVPVFDKQGNIYVAWAWNEKIYFDKSTDGGKTWLDKDIVIAHQPEGWTYDIPGTYRANGMPILCIDNSSGEHSGTLYVNWSDQRNGTNDTDIFISKSTDKGKTWTKPKRVNKDKTQTHQYLTWMQIDPITGYIYIVYYDRSKYDDNQTDVSLSISTDGGESFNQKTISDRPFTPRKILFMGDYNNIDAYNGIITPIWTDYNDKKLRILSTTIKFE